MIQEVAEFVNGLLAPCSVEHLQFDHRLLCERVLFAKKVDRFAMQILDGHALAVFVLLRCLVEVSMHLFVVGFRLVVIGLARVVSEIPGANIVNLDVDVLFWNPRANNKMKTWTPAPLWEEWRRACSRVGEDVPFQEGTRHSILTALGQELPERMLQAFSRHKSPRSLDHYVKPRVTRAAILKATRKEPEKREE